MKNSNHNGIPPFATLPLRHHFMFGQVMQNPRICKLFLEALFEWEIEDIKYVHREKDLDDSFLSRGVRLDIYLRDSEHVTMEPTHPPEQPLYAEECISGHIGISGLYSHQR